MSINDTISSSYLVGYRDAAIAAIKAQFPDLREVDKHGGVFSEAQLQRYSLKAPCARVAILGIQKASLSSTGELDGPLRMAAYVIAQDVGRNDSFDVAMALAEQIAGFVQGNAFGYARAGMANVLEVQNLFSLDSDKKGVTIVGVAWSADVRFGIDTFALDSGDDPNAAPLSQLYPVDNGQETDPITAEGLGL